MYEFAELITECAIAFVKTIALYGIEIWFIVVFIISAGRLFLFANSTFIDFPGKPIDIITSQAESGAPLYTL